MQTQRPYDWFDAIVLLFGWLTTAFGLAFEFGSAAFQIAIVLASSYLITGVIYLLWGAAGLGVLGLLFTIIGIVAPHALSLLLGGH